MALVFISKSKRFKNSLIKTLLASICLLLLTACQIGYIAESAYYQADLLRRRVPIKYALENYKLTEDQKAKLELAIEVRKFMKEELGLNTDSNYTRYVHLDRDYVTYVVSASPKDSLTQHNWSFPIVGKMPYKGYFKKESAEEEVKRLEAKNLDTNLRGVSAYSTLGWFEDPILSTMLLYKEHSFVSTLIHETVHANLFIKSEAKFNERMATFLGQLGAEAFYKTRNQVQDYRKIVEQQGHDNLMFSLFISKEIENLKGWYQENKNNNDLLNLREKQFSEIKERFKNELKPKLQTNQYDWFIDKKLNNALLLLLGLYNSDFSDFEKLADKHQRNFNKVFEQLKTLEKASSPEESLKQML